MSRCVLLGCSRCEFYVLFPFSNSLDASRPLVFEKLNPDSLFFLSSSRSCCSQHLESILVWPVGQGPNAVAAEEEAVEDAEEEEEEVKEEGEPKPVVNGK